MVSPRDELRIGYSKLKQARLALISMVLILASASLALHWLPGIENGSAAEFAGWAGLALFGLCLVIFAWQLATTGGDVVTLSAQGLSDLRMASEPVPWSAIRHIRVFEVVRQKMIVIEVDPQVEAGLHLTRLQRWTREPNRRLGADGLYMSANDLKIDHDELLEAIEERWAAATRAPASDAASRP